MLDQSIKSQVTSVFQLLEGNFSFAVKFNPSRSDAQELVDFVNDVVSCSLRLSATFAEVSDNEILEFSLLKEGEDNASDNSGSHHSDKFWWTEI
jgi:alkyl hydroperoxide reductase subunit F